MSILKNVAVIGTGVIGTGWIIRCWAHGKKVRAYDINLKYKNILIKEISNVLQKYQIKIDRLFEKSYIKNFFEGGALDLSIIAFKIKNGYNQNEIALVPKSFKKTGFFEKFFQLFS